MKKLIRLLLLTALAAAMLRGGNALARGGDTSPISVGRQYRLVTPASEAYPDDGKLLTDGAFGAKNTETGRYYSSGRYVGFHHGAEDGSAEYVIILDLGKSYNDITSFSAGYLNEPEVGIFAPKQIDFAVSETENGEYTDIGSLVTERSANEKPGQSYVSTLAADGAEGRYVRVTVHGLGSYADASGAEHIAAWTFIDEISVASAAQGGTGDTPQTGDRNISALLPAAAALAAISLLLCGMKKRIFRARG